MSCDFAALLWLLLGVPRSWFMPTGFNDPLTRSPPHFYLLLLVSHAWNTSHLTFMSQLNESIFHQRLLSILSPISPKSPEIMGQKHVSLPSKWCTLPFGFLTFNSLQCKSYLLFNSGIGKLLLLKGQIVNILVFLGHPVSVATTQICHCSIKAVRGNMLMSLAVFQ